MKVRKPSYDYSASMPRWCRTYPEYSQIVNIASLTLPYLEPYLNTVMRRAQSKLHPDHPLNEDISLFCKQEAAHYLHRKVAYDVYRTLFGGYFYRVYGLLSFLRDLRVVNRDALKYVLKEDAKRMSAEEQVASRKRFAEIRQRESRFVRSRLIRVMSPWYTPHKLRQPRGIAELLQKIDAAA
jgi:predicted metal-dependent hydrolase